jgi:hypothetical protein
MQKPWVLALVAGLIVLLLALALPLWRMASGGVKPAPARRLQAACPGR